MCDPITIASLAATAVGTVMQMQAQQKAREQTQAAMADNQRRNDKLFQQNQVQAAQARTKYNRTGADGFDSKLSNDTTKLAQQYKAVQSDGQIPGQYGFGKQDVPDVVKQYETDKMGEEKQFANNYADALANMTGFGQTMQGLGINTAHAGQVVNMNNTFAQGNNNVLQQRLAGISNSSPLGDILTGLGGIGLSAGLRAPTAAASTAGSFAAAPGAMSVMGSAGPMSTTPAWMASMPKPTAIPGMPMMSMWR